MTNLTLTEVELGRLLKAYALVAGGITAAGAGIAYYLGERDPQAFFKFVSWGLAGATGAFLVFTNWAWRWGRIANLMKRSVVHGVWGGHLQSDFDDNGQAGMRLPIVFVVRQTYLTLSIRSLTQSKRGSSTLEALIRDNKTAETQLSYVFRLDEPWVPGGKRGTGAGELQLESGGKVLRGVYWTDSATHGQLQLEWVGEDGDGISTFQDAARKYPRIRNLTAPSPVVTRSTSSAGG